MPAPRQVYLHLGLQKTGTSYLQGVMRRNRDLLAEQGLDLVPERSAGVVRADAAACGGATTPTATRPRSVARSTGSPPAWSAPPAPGPC